MESIMFKKCKENIEMLNVKNNFTRTDLNASFSFFIYLLLELFYFKFVTNASHCFYVFSFFT